MVVDLRNPTTVSDHLRDHCLGLQSWMQLAWKEPIARMDYDMAEKAICGQIGCASGKKHVRFILENRTNPEARIASTGDELDIVLSYAMMQLMDGASRGVLKEIYDLTTDGKSGLGSMTNWLDKTSSERGGAACQAGFPMPYIPDPNALGETQDQLALQMEQLSASVLEFIFLHELAHQMKGVECGALGATKTQQEMACDRFASRWLLDVKVAPVAVIAWMRAFDEYIQIQDPLLRKASDNQTFRSMFPAMNWKDRANALNAAWHQRCDNASTDLTTGACANFPFLNQMAQHWISSPEPKACVRPGGP